MNEAPRKGERWDRIGVTPGRFTTCRVMADPIEGYVMARFKGATPFVLHVNDWQKNFTRKPSCEE